MNYAKFAGFYDEIMGDRTPDIDQVRGWVGKYLPTATSLLELGCGTGALLAGLSEDLEVTGVDQSAEMLAKAAAKLPMATLVSGDITKVALGTRFDVVICMFDTLNHLPEFSSWLEFFDRVHEHLADGGLFIFDVNTIGRLQGLSRAQPYVQDFDGHTLIMNISPAHDSVVLWETKIFERLGDDDLYRLHHERIHELAVPLDTIRETLGLHFEVLEETDLEDGPVSDASERIYFACRHRS